MPVLRYFVYVGGALLALLLVCNAMFAPIPLPATLKSGSDLPAVRIRSERKWPERVVIDTTVPTVPVKTAQADVKGDMALPVSTAADTQKAKVRDAFAQLGTAASIAASSPRPATLKVADATVRKVTETRRELGRTEAKPKRRIARTRPSRPMMVVAQQPQPHFGFFDSIW